MRSKLSVRKFEFVHFIYHFINTSLHCISATNLKYRLPAIAVFDIVITVADALSNNDGLIPPWGPPVLGSVTYDGFKRTQELHSTVRQNVCDAVSYRGRAGSTVERATVIMQRETCDGL